MLGTERDCPSCGEFVTIIESITDEELAAISARAEAYRLRELAGRFIVAFWVFITIGFVVLIAMCLWENLIPTWIAASPFGFAAWLYLIGQLIYIRAALATPYSDK